MANNISQRPWILDTPSANSVKPGRTFLSGFVFRDYTGADTSRAVFQDSRGIVIARIYGNADGTPVGMAYSENISIIDLKLTALDSGVVEVIIK